MTTKTIRQLATLASLIMVTFFAWPSAAKLDPYYVLRGLSFGQTKPRILFVLDTSGSMTWKADASGDMCEYSKCEEGTGTELSRIAAARQAIRQVVSETKSVADFALMTFGQNPPPTSGGHVPDKCRVYNYSTGRWEDKRFYWFTSYKDDWGNRGNANLWGYNGRWLLCGENRPYPYLRWDNLGIGALVSQNHQSGEVPPSPLIATNQSFYSNQFNADRKVQFFPKYMGSRVHLNDSNDSDREILHATYGDYGTSDRDRNSNVWDHDFYYWPYVEGFPGYSYDWISVGRSWMQIGVVGAPNSSGASLYAPFFLDAAEAELNPNARGPSSKEEAMDQVLSLSNKMIEGGVDADGDTPWRSAVGPITGSPPRTNGPFSHSTIASYIAFVKNFTDDDICVPIAAILITDGDPTPSSEGGSGLYSRLAAVRNQLHAKIYVVGFVHQSAALNEMACAAAGSDNSRSPCSGTPADHWDTCLYPDDPGNRCAFLASDPVALAKTLVKIVQGEINTDLSSGPGFSVNEFGIGKNGEYGDGDIVQTAVTGSTEWPGWKGHVERSLCTEKDPDDPDQPAEYCTDVPFDAPEEKFGPCPVGRSWDAGECLAQTVWKDRRIYTNNSSNHSFRISNPDGTASSEFLGELNALDLNIPGAPFQAEDADAIAAFILGKSWLDNWKLPGLAQSAPIVVRRIPKKSAKYAPNVGIRDPHCAGRRLDAESSVPQSLEQFSEDTWDPDNRLTSPSPHFEYQEAVLAGDDLGILHAFQLDSGNELWGFLPRFLLKQAVEQYAYGGIKRGQSEELDEHIYGLGGTLNHAWVFDADADDGDGKWRHLALIGAAKGGNFLMALDVSHMSPSSNRGPIEILWTSHDPHLAPQYNKLLGETWARPAITYHVPNDTIDQLPKSYVVFGSGYPSSTPTDADQGKVLVMADGITGRIVESASVPSPATSIYDDSFGTTTDPAISTHCVSRYWAEGQEVYLADLAGRIFRWDIARETEHKGDSGSKWQGTAIPAATFYACQGSNQYDCSISAGNKADPFYFGPAVVSNNRIDDKDGEASGSLPAGLRDQFLIALNSGSLYESSIDSGQQDADFHSSIYLLADDHREDSHAGFDVPGIGDVAPVGTHASYFRLALSDIERTRTYQPYPDSPVYVETRKFSRAARPVRPPRITVTGLVKEVDGQKQVVEGVEVYYIDYTIYEPPTGSCESAWYNPHDDEWILDEGSTYILSLRLLATDGQGFNFLQGAGGDLGDSIPDEMGFSSPGLEMKAAQQVRSGDCDDGVCGPSPGTLKSKPCDPNSTPQESDSAVSVGMGFKMLEGFSPVEIELNQSDE